MRWFKKIIQLIFIGIIILIVHSGCVVQTKSYTNTKYFKNTISRLEHIKSGINHSYDTIRAGFSKVSITPNLNFSLKNHDFSQIKRFPIAGFGQLKTKYATGVHDSVFVKTIALKVGRKLAIIVSADLLIMPTNIIDSVTVVLQKNGISRNQLFFTATHTHSSIGGWGYGLLAKLIAGKENHKIEKWLANQIVKSVIDAISDLHEAKIGMGSFNGATYIRNRIIGDPLLNNNDFNYFIVEQISRKKAIIGSFSAHSTAIGSRNTLISADYPGYWQRKVESEGYDMAMFCAGSMGSQSPVGSGSDFEKAKFIGEALADSLKSNYKNTNLKDKVSLSFLLLKINLPKYQMRLTSKIILPSGLSNLIMPLPENVYLQVLRIDDFLWILAPCDFSGELALALKNRLASLGYNAMVTGFNGSYVGYILPSKYYYLDYSESKSMSWFGPTMGDYTMDVIEQMIDAIITNEK